MEKKGGKTNSEKRDESIRRILDAAMEVFAQEGFAGARVDEIAKRAGVNKAMVYYRIGDKNTLYTEVLHNVFGNMADRIANNIRENDPPEEKLRTYISNLTRTIEKHPYLPNLMMREISSGGRKFSELMAKDLASIVAKLGEVLNEGVKKSVFIETKPFILHMMVVGAIVLFRASVPIRERYFHLFNQVVGAPAGESIDQISSEIEKLVLRALKV
jgi:AcrR family transcriptional regulator